jgi:hypothetical protein
MEDGRIITPNIPNVWSFDKELKQKFFAFISHSFCETNEIKERCIF